MSTALDLILSDTESQIEVTVEIDSKHRITGVAKTWYFSTHLRGIESPSDAEFMPFLQPGKVLGPLTRSLTDDNLFSGLASTSPGQLTVTQRNADDDQLSTLLDYVFAGYSVRIKVGKVSDPYSFFVLFHTVTVQVDPTVELTPDGIQAVFPLSSVHSRLSEQRLNIGRYVGIPHCFEITNAPPTASVVAQASYNSAHDVKTFTLVYRFSNSTLPAAARNLLAKISTSTSNNFVLNYNTTGIIECQASISSVAAILHQSVNPLNNGAFHTVVWSLLDKTTSYLMIDNEVISTITPSGSVDLPAVGVRMARFLVGRHSDARIYNRYIPPEEARSISAVRSSGTDLGCVACWRMDDNTGSTFNDYSPTNADATVSGGVLNTDYKWSPTDLGEAQLAGRTFPLNLGIVLNAHAQLIDANRQRYRGNYSAIGWFTSTSMTTLTVKSQGTTLVGGGTDYTAPSNGGDGVFSMTNAESEPITYDLTPTGSSLENFFIPIVALDALDLVGVLTSSSRTSLAVLCPWIGGYWTDQETNVAQILSALLGNSGLFYCEDTDGRIKIGMFKPPVGYGPYLDPCIDMRGVPGNRITWGDLADQSSSFTLCCWVKLQIVAQTQYDWGVSEPNQGSIILIQKGGISGNYALWFQAVGVDAGKLKFRTAGITVSSPAGALSKAFVWYFVAGVFDDAGNTSKLYVAEEGTNLVEIASAASSGTPSTNSNGVWIGDSGQGAPWVAEQHVQIWNSAKNLSQLQSIMNTPPAGNESGLSFFAPLTEGTGSPFDLVSGTQGTITGTVQWAPKFTVDLLSTPSVKLKDFHHLNPAVEVVVGYAKNQFVLSDSDIDSGVSQTTRLALTLRGRDVRSELTELLDRFPNGRKILLVDDENKGTNKHTSVYDIESATRLLRALIQRFGIDNYIGTINFPPELNISRLACGLDIEDEVGIVTDFPSQLQVKRSFRVVSVSPNLLQLNTNVVVVG